MTSRFDPAPRAPEGDPELLAGTQAEHTATSTTDAAARHVVRSVSMPQCPRTGGTRNPPAGSWPATMPTWPSSGVADAQVADRPTPGAVALFETVRSGYRGVKTERIVLPAGDQTR